MVQPKKSVDDINLQYPLCISHNLLVRSARVLANSGIYIIDDLIYKSWIELSSIPGMDTRILEDIKSSLLHHGISLPFQSPFKSISRNIQCITGYCSMCEHLNNTVTIRQKPCYIGIPVFLDISPIGLNIGCNDRIHAMPQLRWKTISLFPPSFCRHFLSVVPNGFKLFNKVSK